MHKTKDLKEELLKQMDGYSIETKDVISTSARTIIDKHKNQLRRRKWIAAISWLFTLVYIMALYDLKNYTLNHSIENGFTDSGFWLIRYSDLTIIVVVIISILLTYLVYSKSKTLTMLQICARLAGIEEQLKKISQSG